MKELTSTNNDLVKESFKLKDKKYRDLTNKFLVEGYHLVDMAKDYLEIVFVKDKKDYGLISGVSYYLVNDDIIKKLSQTQNSQGIIGVCHKKKEENIKDNNVIILDNIQDPGNVGTIIRSALAFGYHDIILSNDSVDVYNDKVIRSSQGAIFKINILYQELFSALDELKKKGYKVFGTALNNAKELRDISFESKNAIILGNEGNGIRPEVLAITDENIFIEMNKDIDSLNVGVAGSIIMYELSKNK